MDYNNIQLCKKCKLNPRAPQASLCPACLKERRSYDKDYFKKHVIDKSASAATTKRQLLKWYNELKNGKHCQAMMMGCSGGPYDSCQLDYDHLPERGPKKGDVSKMVRLGYSKEKIMQEIAKCWLICSNCHRLITKMRHHKMLGVKNV